MVVKKTKKKAKKAATRKILRTKKSKSRKTAPKKVRSMHAVKKTRVKRRIMTSAKKKTKVMKMKRPAMKRPARKPLLPMPVHEQEIGKIAHYFTHIGVGVVELTGTLEVGDIIHIKGHTTDLVQEIESMQIDRESVQEARAGQSIGLKVKEHVRQHDVVYKVVK